LSELDSLLKKINKLREKMEALALIKGSLSDPEVVAISQRLDVFIVKYQKIKTLVCVNLLGREGDL